MRIAASLIALFFLCPGVSRAEFDLFNAEDYSVEFEGRYWQPKLSGTVTIVDKGIGSDIDPVNDLGFDERKGFGEGRFQIKFLQENKFNFSYTGLKWTAEKNLTKTIFFNGLTYPVGTRVDSRLEVKMAKGGYEYDFLTGKQGFLGVTVDAAFFDVAMELNAPALARDETAHQTPVVPLLGLHSRWVIVKWLSLTGKVSGLPMGGYGYFLDAEGSLDINPVKYFGISVGYRYLKAHLNWRDDHSNLALDGPYAAFKIRF